MRAPRWLLLLALAAPACSTCPAPRAATAEGDRAACARVLDDWHDAAARADLARYFEHLAEDAVFLGTDAGERWSKEQFLAYARPHFAKGKAWRFRATRRAVTVLGALAIFDEDLETEGLGPARGSGALALRDGRWRILHYDLAITVPNERFDLARDAAGAARVLAPEQGPLEAVALLSGSWVGATPDGVVEEHWSHAAGSLLVGMGRVTAGGATKLFEALRVEARPGGLVYVAQPRGGAPTEFRLSPTSTKERLVFENPDHDYPKRLVYERAGRALRVEISGGPGQPVERWTLERAVVARAK